MTTEPEAVDLEAIKARVDAATEGPWFALNERADGSCPVLAHLAEGGRCWVAGGSSAADAEFIAHARADIPNLVAEVERLRDDRWQAGYDLGCITADDQLRERLALAESEKANAEAAMDQIVSELRADNERLIEALRRRNEPPTDERLSSLLVRAQRGSKSRTWRLVGYLVRCVQRAEAERDALQRQVDAVRAETLREAAREVHGEARWQQELIQRGKRRDIDSVGRLRVVESILINRAEYVETLADNSRPVVSHARVSYPSGGVGVSGGES